MKVNRIEERQKEVLKLKEAVEKAKQYLKKEFTTEEKLKLFDAVYPAAQEYMESMSTKGGVSPHVKDTLWEKVLKSLYGKDVYKTINLLHEL